MRNETSRKDGKDEREWKGNGEERKERKGEAREKKKGNDME